MGVGDHEADPAEAPFDKIGKESLPEGVVFSPAHVKAHHAYPLLARPAGGLGLPAVVAELRSMGRAALDRP